MNIVPEEEEEQQNMQCKKVTFNKKGSFLLLTLASMFLLLTKTTFYSNNFRHVNNTTTSLNTEIIKSITSKEVESPIISNDADKRTDIIKLQVVKSKVLWPSVPKCEHFKVSLVRKGTFPPCGLLSSPCSGNTWTRNVIESMTGIATGSVYTDQTLVEGGFIGESSKPDCGCTIVQKTHSLKDMRSDMRLLHYRGIIIIRNPYYEVVSYINYRLGGKHVKVVDKNYSKREWKSKAYRYLKEWERINIAWIKSLKTGIVVHYEELKENMLREIKRMLSFLKIPFTQERYTCLENHEYTKFKREKSEKQEAYVRKTYDDDLHKIFDKAIRQVDVALKNAGHPSIPYHLYSYFNDTLDR